MHEQKHEHHGECCGHEHSQNQRHSDHCHCDSCHIVKEQGGQPAQEKSCGEGCSCTHSHSEDGGGDDDPDHSHSCESHDDGCGCGHDHGAPAEKNHLIRLGIGAVLFAAALLLPTGEAIKAVLFLISYLAIGGDVLLRALRNIAKGKIFDENFLMTIATVGAFLIGEYPEGVAVMLFYQVGELFQSYAVRRSRKSISGLMDIRPDTANLKKGDEILKVSPQQVTVGDVIVIRPGERIPLDCVVLEGETWVDTSALTGESAPRAAAPGDALLSGCINQSAVITARVTREYGESTVARILELVENASSQKAETEAFITRFARWYTPAVVIVAALLALVPPLVIPGQLLADWVYRALVFLVISCPCALVISVPLSFFGGIGGASRAGVLIKGGSYLEALAKAELVVFDKTGTLTHGVFEVTEICPVGLDRQEFLRLAALAECNSTHPIASSVTAAWGQPPRRELVEECTEVPGRGVMAVIEGKQVLAGSYRLLAEAGIEAGEPQPGTVVYLAVDGDFVGFLRISDKIKEDAPIAIKRLKKLGIKKTVMLTGDSDEVAKAVAAKVGVDEADAQLLPGDKVARVEALLNRRSPKGTLLFVGDGINDAPVLARADVGVAMGGLGSDAAIEAADVVLMTDQPDKLADGIVIARRTMAIVKQNIVFAIGVKLIVLALGAAGISTMWEAVFADVGVSVLAILNAMRALQVPKNK